MAYSNYGAFVWKNGAFTSYFSDKELIFKDGEWKFNEINDIEGFKRVGAHAVIPLGKFCLEFYKNNLPNIHFENATIPVRNMNYKNKELDLEISAYPLDTFENKFMYNVRHKNDFYCIVVGSLIGAGYEKSPVSKYIKNNIIFQKWKNGYKYFIKNKSVDISLIINKLDRKYDKNYEWKEVRYYLTQIFKLTKYKDIPYNFRNVIEHLRIIYWIG